MREGGKRWERGSGKCADVLFYFPKEVKCFRVVIHFLSVCVLLSVCSCSLYVGIPKTVNGCVRYSCMHGLWSVSFMLGYFLVPR